MKASILIVGLALTVVGAGAPKPPTKEDMLALALLQEKRQPKQTVIVTGFGKQGELGFTPDGLEIIARTHAQKHSLFPLEFDFARAKTLFYVSLDAEKDPVTVWFTLPDEKIALIVHFDRDGKVTRHRLEPYHAPE